MGKHAENQKRSHLFILRPVELEPDGPVQAAGVRRRVEGTGVARGEGDEGAERDRHVLLDDRHRVSRVDRLRSKSGRDRNFGVARVQDGGRERIDGLVLVDGRDVSGGGLGGGEQGRRRGEGRELQERVAPRRSVVVRGTSGDCCRRANRWGVGGAARAEGRGSLGRGDGGYCRHGDRREGPVRWG